jgi:uncharacterized peroxidase-related enzyme
MTTSTTAASFLVDPPVDQAVQELYDGDREGMGFVMNLSRVWAQSPDALKILSAAMMLASEVSGLDAEERSLMVLATASTMGDAYCSFSYGTRLARALGDEVAAGVVRGDDAALSPRRRALAAWARQIVRDPNATTVDEVDTLRDLGFDDRQIFGLTLFVGLRQLFSTVNDALGAGPDAALVSRTPRSVAEAIDFGRPATPALADPDPPR